MSGNGSNSWGVPFSDIVFLEGLLIKHKNVIDVSRSDDILFKILRDKPGDELTVLCTRLYTASVSDVMRAQTEFGDIDILYIGGGWNSYTTDAKEYCLDNRIGLYITREMTGALWRKDFWNYVPKD